MFVYSTSNVLYSETKLHKAFNNIIHSEFYGFYHFTNICLTVIFYSGCKFNTITLLKLLTWVLLIGVYVCNKLLDNTYIV